METPPQLQDFKDRRPWLIVFGILTILLGAGCLGMSGLMVVAAVSTHSATGQPISPVMLVCGVYVLLSGMLIWLGVGSILCRRWARALLLIFSWGMLLCGICAVSMMAFVMPASLRRAHGANGTTIPESLQTTILLILLGSMALFMIVIPAIGSAFYSRRSVRLTCETRDPIERWTDRCPLPVLAISVMFGLAVPFMLACPLANLSVIAIFGTFVTGWPANLIFVGLAALWAWLAWGTYKLRPAAWWISLGAFLLLGISATMAYATHDLADIYRPLGYTPDQIASMSATGFSTTTLAWITGISILPWLAYLLFLGRYFRRPKLT